MSSVQWNQYSQMSNTVLKAGWLNKFSKGFMGEKWKKVYVTLYKDSSFFWFKNKGDATSKGNVVLKNVCRYLTCGSNVRSIPYSPSIPSWASIDHVIAFPQQPSKKSQIYFFVCTDQAEFDAWMNAIVSTLPPPPTQQQPGQAPPPPTSAPPPAYAPAPQSRPPPMAPGYAQQPPTSAPFYPQPPAGGAPPQPGGGGIGFESLGMPQPPSAQPYPQPPASGAPSPYPVAPPPGAGYAPPPAAYPQQPTYPQNYASPPPRPGPAPAAYPQQQYQAYPTQQGYGTPQYQTTHYQQGYQQPVGATNVVYKNKPKKSKGTGKMLAGLAGGAVAGYAASRIFSPFGGFGWGHGSWGSGSWGSFSGGSFGSFGSFGGD